MFMASLLKTIKSNNMNDIQNAYLSIIKITQYNNFKGNEIVIDLIKNQHLWDYVKPTFQSHSEEFDFWELNDDSPYIDTILIKSTYKFLGKWKYLKSKWNADEIEFIDYEGNLLVKIWFD